MSIYYIHPNTWDTPENDQFEQKEEEKKLICKYFTNKTTENMIAELEMW